jgi:hypothetical protein
MSMMPAVINPLLLVPLKVSTPPIKTGFPALSKPLSRRAYDPLNSDSPPREAQGIVTESVDELLAALLSPGVFTVAVLLIVPEAEALTATTRVIVVAEVPGASGPGFVQVTTWDAAPQVQPEAVADANVKFASSVSDTVIRPTVGPAVAPLLTAMLKVPLLPAVNDPVCPFTIVRSGKLIAELLPVNDID